ncbi:hypothetical protein FisN_22Lh074 [Fistulifera solaris]|uniref:Uncharacterized protein n=1 Tax=Fistulifera solaris TaxID=1519565 RepID=A0A1Z5JCB0_FISSO|nr:hypothetical protein FisN_22Lh074 [Fistulifera solaris]|eukprot:GAX11401.1 hypothetical protein FisN_22Lh074 [Fistulifera solaris]
MVRKTRGNGKSSLLVIHERRPLAKKIIVPFWRKDRRLSVEESVEEAALKEEDQPKEVRHKSFVHRPSPDVFEIVIKDSSTLASSFDSSEEVSIPSAKSYSDISDLYVLSSFDSDTSSSYQSFTEGTPKSTIYSLPAARSFSSKSVKSASVQQTNYLEKDTGDYQSDPIQVETPTTSLPNSPTSRPHWKEDPRLLQHQEVLALFQRLDDFQKKGRLSQKDYQHFQQLLKQYRSDFYIQRISKYLDDIAHRKKSKIKQIVDRDANSIMTETTVSGRKKSHSKGRVSWGSNQIETLPIEFSDDETKNTDTARSGDKSHGILEPEDLWNGAVDFDEQQLQELFVEMCFFARLGYAQPPCCLKCAYKETKGQDRANDRSGPPGHPTCRRWVVWRKNADTLLHPNKLDGNILIMRCNVAQKLLAGKIVGGRRWNAEQRKVTTLSTA